jgi:hypothetical protein
MMDIEPVDEGQTIETVRAVKIELRNNYNIRLSSVGIL